MTLFIQQVINGLAVGAGYGIFAMGFGIVFANMNILSIAHGTLATWAAIIALWGVTTLGLHVALAGFVAVLAVALLGVLMDQLGFQPLRNRNTGGLFGVLLSSIGFWIILLNLALIVTGARFRAFPPDSYPREFYNFGGLVVSQMQLVTIGAALIVGLALWYLVHKTRFGAAVRAVGFSMESAALGGVDSRLMIVSTSGLAGGVVALSGVLLAVMTNNVSFVLGESLLLNGFAAVVIGGFGDVRGALLGGLFIGLSEVLGGQYVSSAFRDAIAFGFLFAFLLWRPRGILGTQELALKL